jgi:hypothetical protein
MQLCWVEHIEGLMRPMPIKPQLQRQHRELAHSEEPPALANSTPITGADCFGQPKTLE